MAQEAMPIDPQPEHVPIQIPPSPMKSPAAQSAPRSRQRLFIFAAISITATLLVVLLVYFLTRPASKFTTTTLFFEGVPKNVGAVVEDLTGEYPIDIASSGAVSSDGKLECRVGRPKCSGGAATTNAGTPGPGTGNAAPPGMSGDNVVDAWKGISTAPVANPDNLPLASSVGKCSPANCRPPLCRCAGTDIPGGLRPDQTPQFVIVTFDDALYEQMWENLAKKLIYETEARDATGCWPRLTWFLTNDNTNYELIDKTLARGSELAGHTVDHLNPTPFTYQEWYDQISSNRNYSELLTGATRDDIVGNRAPWLIYSDNMFSALYRDRALYDSSVVERHDSGMSSVDRQTGVGQWLWPYTLDFGLKQQCMMPSCPKLTFPGLWEVPMTVNVDLSHPDSQFASEMDPPLDGEELFTLFRDNFDSRYKGNRAPFNIWLHGTWLTPNRVAIMQRLYAYAAQHRGVVFGTPKQLIQWIQDPKPIDEAVRLPYLRCPTPPATDCVPNRCAFVEGTVTTCKPCPKYYPTTQGTAREYAAETTWEGEISATLTGGCGDIKIRNTGTVVSRGWQVRIEVSSACPIGNSWGGTARYEGNAFILEGTVSERNVKPGQQISAGFCTVSPCTFTFDPKQAKSVFRA